METAKIIFIKQLRIKNFKGILERTITYYKNTNIFGANETGKSTEYSAYLWLLTGMDEYDRKDFEIKNTSRKDLNSQSHEVEAILIVDGKEEKLKRVYLEKWVKQRGESHKTFEGHKTEFWYNDVPCNATEYQVNVDAIIPANIIKLVTNPYYFNTLPWEKQRAGLLQIAGEITNDQIFQSIITKENNYNTLMMVLAAGKSLEKYKDELKAKKGLLKKTAVEYAPRIDEAKRNKPDAKDWPAIEMQIEEINKQISYIDTILSDASKALAQKQQGILSKQRVMHIKQAALENIRFKIKSDAEQKQNSGSGEITTLENQIKICQNLISSYQQQITNNATNKTFYENQIAEKEKVIVQLRGDWNLINAEKFEFDESKCECPTCHQPLPEHEIESKKQELQKNFNESVASRKKAKVDYSNQVKAEKAQCEEKLITIDSNKLSASIGEEENKINRLKQKLSILKLAETKKLPTDIEAAVDALMKVNGDALNLQDEITKLEVEINSENEALWQATDNEKEKLQKQMLLKSLDELKKQLAIKDTIVRTDERIEQLVHEEEANSQEIANLERQEFEIETFTRAKMDILEKKVNQLFRYVKFRLFEVQVNGGIAETCVCEYLGVPYPTLNTAAKLLAGLDILETLSNFYTVHAPVFCDNRESVTFIPESKSQIISLFVSPADKKIRVEASV